jgi:Patatin-like phospholipase
MPLTLAEHLFAPGPKRVLALDGGGVKGVVTIAFLERMEALLKERSGRGDDFRLSDYFDLVGGTSVGSLLATLIALGYSVAEIKALFWEWAPQIFRRPWFGIPTLSPRFSSYGLKIRANKLLKDRTLESPDLKTGFAIITKRIDTGSPWVLTNNPRSKYWNDPPDNSFLGNKHFRIADLVRASTAAPYYFAPKRIRIVPRARRPRVPPGLFVDGGVSPFNNPALMLLMLAGINGYGFQWDLGAGNLLMASVGTGSYRMRLNPKFLMRRIPGYFAAKAIHAMVGDSDVLSLTLMQWLSAPKRPWEINSEIGTMEGELLGPADQKGDPKPLLAFVRYDARLEMPWLSDILGERLKHLLNDGFVEGLKQLDRPDMMDHMYQVGALAADHQVTPDDFPEHFDVPRPSPAA